MISTLPSGAAMKVVQTLLLVAGATALVASAFVLALFGYTEATGLLGHHGPSDLGAAGLGVLLFAGSVLLGSIVGFAAALWWIWKNDSRPWPRRIWIGVILGIVTGIVLHFANRLPRVPQAVEMFEHLSAAAALTAALGMLGGMIARFTASRANRSVVDGGRGGRPEA